jgi:L-alanine-DL-glutamate epimerase-like enolase superfamily enzyme
MISVERVEVLTAELPFRFSFGHALAARRSSSNVYVRLTLDDGTVGYGEGVPREYVTGETIDGAAGVIAERLGPALVGRTVQDAHDVPAVVGEVTAVAPSDLAACCALELAFLDACGKHFERSVSTWLGPAPASVVVYDAIVPFSSPRKLPVIAVLIRALRLRNVKVKVGADLEADVRKLRALRRMLGPRADLRVDANCAWQDADEALDAIGRLRAFGITAVEQPLPADDLEGLQRVTAETPETIVLDESLRTVGEAAELARLRAGDAFNIRVSKCGGLLNSLRIAEIAAEAGLACIVGAQVGESGLLSAAGRHLAAAIAPRYVEGSGGSLLLKEDLTVERALPGWAGRARPFRGPGLGVTVKEETLEKYGTLRKTRELGAAEVG